MTSTAYCIEVALVLIDETIVGRRSIQGSPIKSTEKYKGDFIMTGGAIKVRLVSLAYKSHQRQVRVDACMTLCRTEDAVARVDKYFYLLNNVLDLLLIRVLKALMEIECRSLLL